MKVPNFFSWSSDDQRDRKSTRLNSSHGYISYAVFCLKKKKKDKSLSCDTFTSPARNHDSAKTTSPRLPNQLTSVYNIVHFVLRHHHRRVHTELLDVYY